ncbi:MAG: hypothetical protein J2P17_05310 [Mycobacterium sp.]|nr:hypothetical protein [Mycobacterium sp.]
MVQLRHLADERARKRTELLAAAEGERTTVAAATSRARRPLLGKHKIALRVGNKFKMATHFNVEITDDSFTFTRKTSNVSFAP